MRFSMAPDSLFPFLFLCCFLIPLSVACPQYFHCEGLGELQFPFINTTNPECGLLPISGCDDPNAVKELQLGTHIWRIERIDRLYVTIHLSSAKCWALEDNLTLSLFSSHTFFHMKNNTFFRCNRTLNVKAPENYRNYASCSDFDYYFDPYSTDDESPDSLKACSVIQLPFFIPQHPSDRPGAGDPSADEISIEVELSKPCLDCLSIKGGQCLPDGTCTADEHKRSDSEALIKGVAIGGAGVIIVGFFLILLRNKLRRKSSGLQNQSRDIESNIYPRTNPESGNVYIGVPVFSYVELEEATNKFDQSRELGNGGFGTVYYGKLKDGREVAIKRLFERNYRRVDQFMNEIKILTRLHHKNLVSLYGCTSHHSRELLLVYEYIPNGTLGCHLHGDLAKPGSLPWPVRMRIAIETASALSYLHACDIIHRDVKTSNLLLDNHFGVKVADFGLSRLFPRFVSHVSTAPAGSPGYLDPEYHQCYQLTNKSDVYSFGVVLIELICSMSAIDVTRNKDEIKLANLAIKKIQRRAFNELVDPSLGFESDNEVKRMIVSVAKLAFQCLQRDKGLRPCMDEVLEVLQKIESGNDDFEHLEFQGAGISHMEIHASLPTSMYRDGVGSLKNLKPQRLPHTL